MNNQNSQNYFNFTANAVAYFNEIKLIETKKSKMCAIKACILEGESDNPEKIYVDLIVKGEKAKQLIWSLKEQWPQGYGSKEPQPKWFACIRIGSIMAKPYLSKDKTEAKATLSARLISISYLKVDDQVIEIAKSEAVEAA